MKPNPVHNGLVSRLILMKSLIKGHGFRSFFKPEIVQAFVPVPFKADKDEIHLDEAIKWLCRAQDACNGKGVSAAYYLEDGWDVAYPETSGYILSTLLTYSNLYSNLSGKSDLIERAIMIGDWEIEIQTPEGAVVSSQKSMNKRVFNTGQVMLGWMDLFENTGTEKYLDAAKRAGDWLLSFQENDGTWKLNTHCGARTYHSRVDWALLKLEKLTGKSDYGDAAIKNLNWVLSNANNRGWFNQCGFYDYHPITHVIDYTLRGLLESYLCSERCLELKILPVLIRSAKELSSIVQNCKIRGVEGLIPTSFDENWQSQDKSSCLTGNSQLACFMYRLYQVTKDEQLIISADSLCQAIKCTQNLSSQISGIRGAIAGSFPLWEGYAVNSYPNWATKFFADALMLKMGQNVNA